MTEDQKIADAARQIVRYAKTAQQVTGEDAHGMNDQVARLAQEQNTHGWGYGLPESATNPEVIQSYSLDVLALRTALERAHDALRPGPHS